MQALVIIPCGKRKVWDEDSTAGPTPAARAYVGTPFKKNLEYAERFARTWMILSAKYGLIRPEFIIPENYDVTFKRPRTNPISAAEVGRQVRGLNQDQYDLVIGLGGLEYRYVVKCAFAGWKIEFPFAGLSQGSAMKAINVALHTGNAIAVA